MGSALKPISTQSQANSRLGHWGHHSGAMPMGKKLFAESIGLKRVSADINATLR